MMKTEEMLLNVTKYLHSKKIPYAVVGGFSAIVWGRGRSTYDIDIIVDQKNLNLKEFTIFLRTKDLSTSELELQEAFNELSHATIHTSDSSVYRIDLQGVYSSLDRETIETAKEITYKGQKIRFGSPENLIAHKLHFGSDRDLEDALVVFIAQEQSLDLDYLVLLSSKLGVGKKLERLLEIAKKKGN
ncbi:MAG: hypothetical protein ACW97Z_14840 [Candidatus Hodarchaeales archaeon]